MEGQGRAGAPAEGRRGPACLCERLARVSRGSTRALHTRGPCCPTSERSTWQQTASPRARGCRLPARCPPAQPWEPTPAARGEADAGGSPPGRGSFLLRGTHARRCLSVTTHSGERLQPREGRSFRATRQLSDGGVSPGATLWLTSSSRKRQTR